MAQQLALDHLQPLVAQAERFLRPHEILGALQQQRRVPRGGGEELEVGGREGPGAAVVEIGQAAHGHAEGNAHQRADPEALDAFGVLELGVGAHVGGEHRQAAVEHLADHRPAHRPLLRGRGQVQLVREERPDGTVRRDREQGGAVGLQVADDGLMDRAQHLGRLALLEELLSDLVEGQEASGAERGRVRGEGLPRVAGGFGVRGALGRLLHAVRPNRAPSHCRMTVSSLGETSWPMGNSCHSAGRSGRACAS